MARGSKHACPVSIRFLQAVGRVPPSRLKRSVLNNALTAMMDLTDAHYSRQRPTVSEAVLSWVLFGANPNVQSEQTFLKPRPTSSSSLPERVVQSEMRSLDDRRFGRRP